jgi:hypothetical protein
MPPNGRNHRSRITRETAAKKAGLPRGTDFPARTNTTNDPPRKSREWVPHSGTPPSPALESATRFAVGESYDQADAEWIVIWRQLRGHNDTPFGRPTPRPAYRPHGGWPPFGRILYVLFSTD